MKTVFFDFDGVIADSTESVLNALKIIAKIKKTSAISKEEYSKIKTKDLFKRLNIKWYEIPCYLNLARRIVKNKKHLIKIHNDFSYAITRIKDLNLNFIIISSNSSDLIEKFNKIYLNNIEFSKIYGNIPIFSKHKILKKVLKTSNLIKNDTFLIGDEIRDIHAAKKVGIKSAAVTWGKDSKSLLYESKPDFIIHNGIELKKILENFANDGN